MSKLCFKVSVVGSAVTKLMLFLTNEDSTDASWAGRGKCDLVAVKHRKKDKKVQTLLDGVSLLSFLLPNLDQREKIPSYKKRRKND